MNRKEFLRGLSRLGTGTFNLPLSEPDNLAADPNPQMDDAVSLLSDKSNLQSFMQENSRFRTGSSEAQNPRHDLLSPV